MSPHAPVDIVTLSDLHLDHRANWLVAEAMAYALIELAPDLLILAGDLASIPSRVEKALRFFQPLAGRVLFVPGNHDLWAPTAEEERLAEVNTWDMYRTHYAKLCEEIGIHYLPSGPYVSGDLAIVGTCGWYDYSLASPLARLLHSVEDFEAKGKGNLRWTDGWRVRWRDHDGRVMHDAEVCRIMEADLAAQIASLPAEVRTVVAVTHHLPFKEVSRSHGGLAGDYFTAFMGSTGLGKVLLTEPRTRLAVYGHIHQIFDDWVEGIRVVARPLGNPRDWSGEVKDVARERMGVFQL